MNNIPPIRLAINSARGLMGIELIHTIFNSNKVILSAAISSSKSNLYGTDVAKLINKPNSGILINYDLNLVKNDFDILIDFTHPTISILNLNFCYKHNKKIVIGTTGFNEEQKKLIYLASKKISIVFSSNFSIIVNLMLKLLKKTTESIGKTSDIEIIEMHHRNKIDAPSGTALLIGETIAKSLGKDLADCAIYNRFGNIGKRQNNSIGFSVIRAGNIIGEHTVIFTKSNEQFKITHKSFNRKIYAKGALKAAIWLFQQKNSGLFSMLDVLNI